jgi:hypothetical protein
MMGSKMGSLIIFSSFSYYLFKFFECHEDFHMTDTDLFF